MDSNMTETWQQYSECTGRKSDDDKLTFYTGAAAALNELIQRTKNTQRISDFLVILMAMTFEIEERAR